MRRHRVYGAECLTDHESHVKSSLWFFCVTGDLAKKKLFFALPTYPAGPATDLNIVGYGRSKVDLTSFIEKQCVNIVEDDSWPKEDFCSRISRTPVLQIARKLRKPLMDVEQENAHASGKPGNRLFFLSVPPTVFGTVAEMISSSARAEEGGFTRLMIEKPFGRDTASFEELNVLTSRHFHESQLFRLDHYLGKEVILNISTLRWANVLFEPLWSCQNIESVMIVQGGHRLRRAAFAALASSATSSKTTCCRPSCSLRWSRRPKCQVLPSPLPKSSCCGP